MATPGALATVNMDTVIERIANGAITQRLAAELGVHHSSLYRQLAQHPEYMAARECGMEARLDSAEVAVMEADECTLPRAREHWRVVTWRAEREHPHRWGQKNSLQIEIVGDLDNRLRRASERTLTGEFTVDPDPV